MEYSVIYDEAAASLMEHQVPLHERYGFGAGVAVVAEELGRSRYVPGSSYNGIDIMGVDDLLAVHWMGWEVACHGMTHVHVTAENAEREMGDSKKVLEDALGIQVNSFCVPIGNESYPLVRGLAHKYGYHAVYTIFDAVNKRPIDPLRMCRIPLHSVMQGPYESVFDPYRRLHQARDMDGWVIDYCHCPLPGKAIDPTKDCTLEEQEERFEKVSEMLCS